MEIKSAKDALSGLMDSRYPASVSKLFDVCESKVERDLYHCLLKMYQPHDIVLQYGIGNYRIDFVTADGVGWELDGAKYHDEAADEIRDNWILNNSAIKKIIRVPAAALMFYRDACLAVFARFLDHLDDVSIYCHRDAEYVTREADEWVSNIHEIGVSEMRASFEMGEAFHIFGMCGFVGSPFAFLSDDHKLWGFIPDDRINLNKWMSKIEVRQK